MNNNRRHFLKKSFLMTGLALISPSVLKSLGFSRAMAADLKPLSEKDPLAVGLGYHADASKVDVKKWSKKAGPDGKIQKCETCMFFTKIDAKTGKCQIFPNNTVLANAWCNSWAKKPA